MAQTVDSIKSFMLGVFSDMSQIKASTGFQSIFSNSGMGAQTVYVENATQIAIDLIRGYKKISKLLERSPLEGENTIGGNSKHFKAQKFQNVAYDFPIIRDSGSVSKDDIIKYRLAGRTATDLSVNESTAAREKFAEIIHTIMLQHAGRMEKQAAEAVLTATCTLDDGAEYDFDRSTSNTITPSVLWSVTATATPIGDLDDAADALQEQGKTEGSAGIIGWEALKAMLATDEIANLSGKDGKRFEFVQAGSGLAQLPAIPADMQYMIANGFKYMAYVKTYKGRDIYLFTYNEKYQTDAGTWTDYMNSKDVLLMDHTARRDRYFGPSIKLDLVTPEQRAINSYLGLGNLRSRALNSVTPSGIIDARMFHHDATMNASRTAFTIETYTGPLYVPTAVDTTCLLDGVIA